ncbi:MAG TPA: DUF1569 domain-containing protein [Sphingobacteriaceae bacterium]
MKTLFDSETVTDIVDRIDRLTPLSKPGWGKMDVAQMLAHCSAVLYTATGITKPKQHWMGILLGRFWKPVYYNETQFDHNSPTHSTWIITDERDFDTEKNGLIENIKRFQKNGMQKVTTHSHPFFGKLTPAQWGIGMFKHLDHHLRQFKV